MDEAEACAVTFQCFIVFLMACPLLSVVHPRKASFHFVFIVNGLVILSSSPVIINISSMADYLCYSFFRMCFLIFILLSTFHTFPQIDKKGLLL
ncbi:unnamed protein product [Onchocerca flexuosa]|uniref:G_PROTEIN_RECEP_F1_2 domain-containing protein n=1 Tax=Onchocerca flexuosa TaxID=387005 RepID=A0A183HBR6_9BILA|nr:unnamed protein product [Onchocerca flexuosa]